jgi:hypothetical protein
MSSIDPNDAALRRYASQIVARAAGVVGLATVGVIHLVDSIDTFHQTPYIGWMYVALILGCLSTAGLLVYGNAREAWAGAVVLALSAIIGFVLSRTTGLPHSTDDIGNWSGSLGLCSLFTESVLIAIAGYALVALQPVAIVSRRSRSLPIRAYS